MRQRMWISAAVLAGAVALGLGSDGPAGAQVSGSEPMVQVVLPDLTGDAVIGARVFAVKCAACHGANGAGADGKGPPLIHRIYEPSHHADIAFLMAAQNGVRAHHWRFGDMPPVEGITRAEVLAVVAFIRQVQAANGIF